MGQVTPPTTQATHRTTRVIPATTPDTLVTIRLIPVATPLASAAAVANPAIIVRPVAVATVRRAVPRAIAVWDVRPRRIQFPLADFSPSQIRRMERLVMSKIGLKSLSGPLTSLRHELALTLRRTTSIRHHQTGIGATTPGRRLGIVKMGPTFRPLPLGKLVTRTTPRCSVNDHRTNRQNGRSSPPPRRSRSLEMTIPQGP